MTLTPQWAHVGHHATTPHEQWFQRPQWSVLRSSLPGWRYHWNGSDWQRRLCETHPASTENPNVIAALFHINPTVSLSFDPGESLAEDTGIHAVQNDGLKAKQQGINLNNYVKHGTSQTLTGTWSVDHVTSTFTCPETRVERDQSWWTISKLPPKRNASTNDDSFASSGRLTSTVPELSMITSS